MRNAIILYTLLIFSAVCFSSCDEKPITHNMTIISDLTEIHFTGFKMVDIKRLSAISENSVNGETVRLVPITELGFNTSYEFSIQKDSSLLMGNDYERTDLINEFFSQIDTSLRIMQSDKKERSGSVIFKVMSEELNKLSESNGNRKTAVINTDFMEMSFINFYHPDTMSIIQNHPEIIKKKLLKKYPLKQLNGIAILFVYLPKDKTDSDRYEVLSQFYRKLFESFGATVRIIGSI